MIIGLSGRIRCGKTEIANYISNKRNINVYKFAKPLKDLVFDMCGLCDDDKLLTGRLNRNINYFILNKYLKKYGYDKLSENEIDHIRAIEYNDSGILYRFLLQYVGTNILRDRNANHWIQEFAKLTHGNKNYIVDDIRFINEYKYIYGLNGSIIYKVVRESDHDQELHPSEAELDKINFEFIFKNDSIDLTTLYNQIDKEILGE